MTRSNDPPSALSWSAAARTLLRSARSTSTSSIGQAPTSRSARSALPRSRAVPTTSAPCVFSARAVSTPRPAETPVTRTRLSLRLTPARTSSVVDLDPNAVIILLLGRGTGLASRPRGVADLRGIISTGGRLRGVPHRLHEPRVVKGVLEVRRSVDAFAQVSDQLRINLAYIYRRRNRYA